MSLSVFRTYWALEQNVATQRMPIRVLSVRLWYESIKSSTTMSWKIWLSCSSIWFRTLSVLRPSKNSVTTRTSWNVLSSPHVSRIAWRASNSLCVVLIRMTRKGGSASHFLASLMRYPKSCGFRERVRILLKVAFLFGLGSLRIGILSWLVYAVEERDTLRYHRALAQQTTVSKYKYETLEGIAVHLAVISSGSSVGIIEATPPCVASHSAVQRAAASATPFTWILPGWTSWFSTTAVVIEKQACGDFSSGPSCVPSQRGGWRSALQKKTPTRGLLTAQITNETSRHSCGY